MSSFHADLGETATDAGERRPLLTSAPPTRAQNRLALALVLVLTGATLITAPDARRALAGTEVLLPAYAAAVLVVELVTAALLLAEFSVQRTRALLVLAMGYLYAGLLAVPWALTFPGVFAATGLDAGLQSTAAIAALRRIGFPLFVIAYAVLAGAAPTRAPAWRSIVLGIAGVGTVAAGATAAILTHADALPAFMRDARNVDALWHAVPPVAVALYLAGLTILGLRRRSQLDVWLMVVLAALLIEIVMLSYVSGGIRLSVGWWAGRLFGLASASTVLVVLIFETTAVHARLAHSAAAERRARQNRLTAMEALSASIAHEVNQPLASMVTNADAGLRWLGKSDPDIGEATAALGRIVADGHRASKVIGSIRTMFLKGAQERVPTDLNALIGAVLQAAGAEARAGRVTVATALDDALPPVIGNPVQLRQVVSNLVDNALDAMKPVTGTGTLHVSTRRSGPGEVTVRVADTGIGLDDVDRERIFAPFYSTKPDGMGMGLMFCRSIIEAHGGRLLAQPGQPRGAVFAFTLPALAPAERVS